MLRRAKRKFSISAPRLAVRPHVPWYLRWALVLPFVLLAVVLIWLAYDTGLELAGFYRNQSETEIGQLNSEITRLKTDNARLSEEAAANERQAQIDRAASQETSRQLSVLNSENASLKEDLAFFQTLTVPGRHDGELTIPRARIEPDALPGEYRYRFLLVRDGPPRTKEFHGSMQLLVNISQDGKESVLTFPEDQATGNKLNFKFYQRVENSFRLPTNARLVSAQLRIFEDGSDEPRIKKDIALSRS